MTNHTNETPEPLAGPSVESCATALAEALRREKGWLLDYADSVIRDAIDRKHLGPLAQERAGEMPTLPKSLLNTIGEYGMARTDRVSELTIQHRWLRLVAGIKEFTASVLTARLSDIRAALQAKDAEIAGLKADAGRLDFTEEQCIDLFAAALYISARGDETSVLSEENADRISEFLCDLAGVDLDAMKGEAA